MISLDLGLMSKSSFPSKSGLRGAKALGDEGVDGEDSGQWCE